MEPRNKNILIVDDEEPMRNLLQVFTLDSDLGLNITTAESAQDAIIKSAQLKYDLGLVILDGLNGRCFSVAEVIRENNPLTKIVLCSSNADILDQLPHPLFDSSLPKPFTLSEYTSLLKSLYQSQDNPAP